ncbi:PAS domain-containing protein [Maribellus sediminis]|uniref:PAS domain-containing protein n=1 Tax=Maribellus sediminis TaxID=2696285 RepID=UPI0014306E00|nr:PAS domain-containing protein [Maribellus sediminis]
MSELSNHRSQRLEKLKELFSAILRSDNVKELYEKYKGIIGLCVPTDIVYLVDELVKMEIPMPELKKGINKLLNLLYKTIAEYPYFPPREKSFLWVCVENNRLMLQKLTELKPVIKELNRKNNSDGLSKSAVEKLVELESFSKYYLIKENLLFPVIEKHVPEFRCLSVMWSFHDDIKRNLKRCIEIAEKGISDQTEFNRLIGEIYFNMNAVKFREERILFPLVEEKVPEKELDTLLVEALEIGFPFYEPDLLANESQIDSTPDQNMNLGTGNLTVEQVRLLFNHLPVDLTFVDENDTVQYFSAPKKRIFPRTKAIIGRDVHNCHPKESVHVVEKIIRSFKAGEKDDASFWITMNGEMLLIQYFAIRDDSGTYKGVVEVSQEITGIQQLTGEKKLLDW